MKAIIRTTILSLTLGLFGLTQAQSDVDLFRYSQNNYYGNARFNAMSGAFGALGGNFGALSTNPAAIGFFSKSEFVLTPAFDIFNSKAEYNDITREGAGARFVIPNASIVIPVFEGSQLAKNEWRRVQIGFGINRTNDYNGINRAQGMNNTSSLMDALISSSNGTSPTNLNPFLEKLAYQTYLLDPTDTVSWRYTSPISGGGLMQKKTVTSSGATTEMVFSVGGNFSDKLYIGMTIGVPFIDYYERSVFEESNTEDRTFYREFQKYSLEEKLRTRGVGVNLKLGLIYKPVDFFRLGLAIHTPTYYRINESYESRLDVNMKVREGNENKDYLWASSPSGYYEYNMVTPFKAMGSLGFVIGQYGCVGVDAEFVDYRTMKMRNVDDFSDGVNEVVEEKYAPTANLRVGTEWRAKPFSFRAGYAYQGNPYSAEYDTYWSNHSYSLGLGLAVRNVSFDLAFNHQLGKSDYYMYNLQDVGGNSLMNPVLLKQNKYMVSFSVGFRF